MGTLVGCVFSVGLAASMKTSALAKPGSYWENGKENGNYWDYRGYIGLILGLYRDYRVIICWGYIGMMEKKIETTKMGYIGIIG